MHISPATAAPARHPHPATSRPPGRQRRIFMGCLWERRYGTDRTSPPRQKQIPIPTGQRTVRRNRKDRRPIRLQSPWKPSPSPTERQEKKEKNNQKDNKNAQKRGTENLIRGKSVAPDLNIYAKHAPNPAYIPYIIHSVSAKRKINRKRTVLRSAHNESKSYANHTINRWKRK